MYYKISCGAEINEIYEIYKKSMLGTYRLSFLFFCWLLCRAV